jgi:hypothetical protein
VPQQYEIRCRRKKPRTPGHRARAERKYFKINTKGEKNETNLDYWHYRSGYCIGFSISSESGISNIFASAKRFGQCIFGIQRKKQAIIFYGINV